MERRKMPGEEGAKAMGQGMVGSLKNSGGRAGVSW